MQKEFLRAQNKVKELKVSTESEQWFEIFLNETHAAIDSIFSSAGKLEGKSYRDTSTWEGVDLPTMNTTTNPELHIPAGYSMDVFIGKESGLLGSVMNKLFRQKNRKVIDVAIKYPDLSEKPITRKIFYFHDQHIELRKGENAPEQSFPYAHSENTELIADILNHVTHREMVRR